MQTTDEARLFRSFRLREDDDGLVAAARTGDHQAFTALVRRHDDGMRALAWSIVRDGAAVDDVLQDAYLKAYRSLARFRGDSRFPTWLHQIVYRTGIDHLRRRRAVVPLDDTDPPAPDRPQGEVVDRVAIERALATLDPETAAALVLVDRDGRTYDDAGQVLGIPAGTVASRLHRGRRAMRVALDPIRAHRSEGDER